MKKVLKLITVAALMFNMNSFLFAQCLQIKQGQVYKIKTSAGAITYNVDNVTVDGKAEFSMFSTVIDGKEHRSILACINDTFYITRIANPNDQYIITKGDTTGINIFGVQAIHNNIKVGDYLKPYEDLILTFPVEREYDAQYAVFSHWEKDSYTTYNTEKYWTGFNYNGTITTISTVTETKAVYNYLPMKVKESSSFGLITINYMNAECTGEEEIDIGGTKHKAFIIESESWVKYKMEKSYESTNKEWADEANNYEQKIKNKKEKRESTAQSANGKGYMVMTKKEWFVPGLGIAKMELKTPYSKAFVQILSIK
jgi:hypothetical protein